MPGRITSSILSSDYLRNMRRNMSNMRTLQNQLSSGKEIQNVSDNPYKASRSMQLHTEISYNKQYNENIKDTSNWLDTTDTALAEIGNVFGRIETLLVRAGNAAFGPDERLAIQDELKQTVNQISQILNTNFDGSYIFGGTKTASKPTTVVNGVLEYANTMGQQISAYLDAAGNVTNKSVSSNTILGQNDPIYLDNSGKVTTTATTNGVANTQIIQGSSLFVDQATGTVSTVQSGTAKPLLLKDELYVDPNGNITPERTTDNTLVNSDNELFYLTTDGKVTTTYNSTYTLITTGTPLYKGTDGQVTISGAPENQISAATPIYKNAAGYVTTSSITVNSTLPNTVSSVNTLQVSNYDPTNTTTGYNTVSINPSCNIYIDSRGVLTNSSNTDLSNRKATLKELWTGAYVDSASKQVKTTMPIPVPNNQINLYKDSSGNVTTSPGGYPANQQILLGTNLYKDTTTGKITTVAGATTTQMQLTDTVYVDLNGDVIVPGTAPMKNNTAVSLRDTLAIDTSVTTDSQAKAVIGNPAPNTAIPSDSITLYLDGTHNITNDATVAGAQKIILSDSLYKDIHENITVLANTQNTLVDSDDKLYYDSNGNVTNLAAYPQVILGTTLYKDANGMVTTLHGEAPPNEPINLTDVSLYKDSKGNVTIKPTSGGVVNKLIDSQTGLYKDANGNVTTVAKNTSVGPTTQLYKTSDGKSVVADDPLGSTFAQFTSNGTNLYRDINGNVTTTSGPGYTQITSGNDLYEDSNGNIVSLPGEIMSTLITQGKLYKDTSGIVTTAPTANQIVLGTPLFTDATTGKVTTVAAGNTPIASDPRLVVDGSGNLDIAPQLDQAKNSPIPANTKLYIDPATNKVMTRLIRTGEAMYSDNNGKIVTLKNPQNEALAKSDVVYKDAAGNLTLSANTANKELTTTDIKNLQSELQNPSITQARKNEINTILTSGDAALLVQLTSELTVDISQGVKTDYNKTAVDVLEFTDKNGKYINVSELLTKIITDLGTDGNRDDITNVDLKDIQAVTSNLLKNRSEVGAMQNRMESAQGNNEAENYNMTDILSKTEDIDWAEKAMEYSIMQTVYTSSLQTSAKILPQTILNYL